MCERFRHGPNLVKSYIIYMLMNRVELLSEKIIRSIFYVNSKNLKFFYWKENKLNLFSVWINCTVNKYRLTILHSQKREEKFHSIDLAAFTGNF